VPDDGLREFLSGRLAALSRTAYLLTGDHHAAEDLLQNTLVIVAARWHRVSAADDPAAYVRRILYHEHVSSWRRNRHLRAEHSTASVPERAGPRDMSGDIVRRVVLERALARLTPRQRAVIVARFYEDLTEIDAAAALGCSVGTIKSQTHHALGGLGELAPELADLVHRSVVEVTV
jgi:RNA polymerase sigma-70 factor (sigma-E family)